MKKEIERGDKVFYKSLFGNVYGFANYIGDTYILVDEHLWYDENPMMKYCKKIEKDKVKLM